MIKPRTNKDLPNSRIEMREKLVSEFTAFHQRRSFNRRLTQITIGTILVAACAIGAIQNARLWERPIAKHPNETKNALADPTLVGTKSESNRNNQINPASYTSMKVEILTDESLEKLLQETQTDWFVASVDGKMQAFQVGQGRGTRN